MQEKIFEFKPEDFRQGKGYVVLIVAQILTKIVSEILKYGDVGLEIIVRPKEKKEIIIK